MDRQRLQRLSRLPLACRRIRGVQRQIHEQSDRAARRLVRQPVCTPAANLPEFLSTSCALAVHGSAAGSRCRLLSPAAATAGMTALDIPAAWARSADTILRNRWRTILVLGATDRGKSTYCAVLGARLSHARRRVALVDADVGQKDVGPPATI